MNKLKKKKKQSYNTNFMQKQKKNLQKITFSLAFNFSSIMSNSFSFISSFSLTTSHSYIQMITINKIIPIYINTTAQYEKKLTFSFKVRFVSLLFISSSFSFNVWLAASIFFCTSSRSFSFCLKSLSFSFALSSLWLTYLWPLANLSSASCNFLSHSRKSSLCLDKVVSCASCLIETKK